MLFSDIAGFTTLSESRTPDVVLALLNVFFLAIGLFLHSAAAIILVVPIVMPLVNAVGIDPVHFGVMAVTNIMFGLVTPPYGLLLFMMTKVANVPLREIVREVMPFLGVMFVALLLITYVPSLVTWVPNLVFGGG